MKKTRVLVVDDSSFMRLVVSDMLNSDERIEVIDTAENGKEAAEKTLDKHPDCVVLDLHMAAYDGFYAITKIMQQKPTPIIVLSAQGESNTSVVFDAIQQGAVDFLNKPSSGKSGKIRDVAEELCNRVVFFGNGYNNRLTKNSIRSITTSHSFPKVLPYEILLIGASTGGPGIIENILSRLPNNTPFPVVVVQHMPGNFVLPFAQRLDAILPLQVKVAKENTMLEGNTIYIVDTICNLKLIEKNQKLLFVEEKKRYDAYNHPSIDCLMESAAQLFGSKAIGTVVSGMGKDGTLGLKKIKESGGLTIAQDESTAIIYGMPKAAYESGAAQFVLPDKEITPFIISNF